MSRPPRIEFDGAVYHVIARGNERRAIFRDDHDRQSYLDRLGTCAWRLRFVVYAYCLMPNHVHLALRTERIPLSRIMLRLHGAYAQTFNRRHGRVGHLFQGRYKAFLVAADEYLASLVRYIHRNPVKARLVSSPDGYRWSSDAAYRGGRHGAWLDTSVALARFGSTRAQASRGYRTFVEGDAGVRYESVETRAQLVKGDEVFARQALRRADADFVRRSMTAGHLGRIAERVLKVPRAEFRTAPSAIRGLTAYVGRELGRVPLCRTAELFAKHESTIVKDVRLIERRLETEDALRSELARWKIAAEESGNQR